MNKFTLRDMPPAKSLWGYMDTGRKRDIIDGWLAAAMVWAQRLINGPKEEWAECVRASLIYARAICKLSKSVRESEIFNNQLRIRAHVLASIEGKAWARDMLGEANIRRWQNRYDACRKTGWLPEKSENKAKVKSTQRTTPKSYNWKPITLPKISEMFFEPIDFSFPELTDPFAKQLFAWPRERRVLSPAVFWPHELEDDYEPEPNTKPVPGPDPGSSAPAANLSSSALDPGSSPGTDGKEVKPP